MKLINSLILALFGSLFIYLEYMGIKLQFIDTILALMAIYMLFVLSKKELFVSGFLIGLFWFWWIGYSFEYYDLIYLIPIVLIGVGLLYGLLFYIGGLKDNLFYRGGYFFLLSFIDPFGFNWFKLELLFINSYIGTSKLEFLIILFITASFIYLYNKKMIKASFIFYAVGIVGLFFFNFFNKTTIIEPSLKIYLNETNVEQKDKWKQSLKKDIILDNLKKYR